MELYVEEVPLGNVVAFNPFVPSASCTFSQPPANQVLIDSMVNLGESDEMGHSDDGNKSNELIDDPSEDDVDVDDIIT